MKINNETRYSFIIFVIIAIWYAIGNFVWWELNEPVLPINFYALHFLDIFKEGPLINAPLVTYIMRFMFFIFGAQQYDLIVIFVNYCFFLVPLYFVYKIGVELKDRETGNIAMILFALVPAIYGMSRQYGHKDYQIVAGITFNIYCLIKTNYFKDRKWSIIYGISIGLGAMIKDSFLAYFFVPFLYTAIMSFKNDFKLTRIINILLATCCAILIAGSHYFRQEIIGKLLKDNIDRPVQIFEFENIRVMTIGLWEKLLSPPIFIIFFIGLIYFLWKYKGKYKDIVLLWFFVPWAVIIFMGHYKLAEYGAGFIPAMILMGSIYVSGIKKQLVKKLILAIIIVVGLMQYFDFSYAVNFGLSDIKFYHYEDATKTYDIKYYNEGYNRHLTSMIAYDQKRAKIVFNLVDYLKKRYPNVTFYVWSNLSHPITSHELVLVMELEELKYLYDPLPKKIDITSADIIINIGNRQPIQSFGALRFETDPLMYEQEFNRIQKIFEDIDENFFEIDTFYLTGIKEESHKVQLLARKNKFFKKNKNK